MRRYLRVLSHGVFLAVGLSLSAPVAAQISGSVIDTIRVEGNQRIEAETVQSYLSIKPGDPYSPRAVNDSLKSLFATGAYFLTQTAGVERVD